MKYALLHTNSVRFVELRETKSYLIDDRDGSKYKKFDDREYVASNSKFKDWSWTGSDVYSSDHPKVIAKINEIKEKKFILNVERELDSFLKNISYDDAVKLNDFLNLGVE